VVVTGPDAIEQWRGDFDPEGLAGLLFHRDLDGQMAALQLDVEVGLVDEQLVLDDIAWTTPFNAAISSRRRSLPRPLASRPRPQRPAETACT